MSETETNVVLPCVLVVSGNSVTCVLPLIVGVVETLTIDLLIEKLQETIPRLIAKHMHMASQSVKDWLKELSEFDPEYHLAVNKKAYEFKASCSRVNVSVNITDGTPVQLVALANRDDFQNAFTRGMEDLREIKKRVGDVDVDSLSRPTAGRRVSIVVTNSD